MELSLILRRRVKGVARGVPNVQRREEWKRAWVEELDTEHETRIRLIEER